MNDQGRDSVERIRRTLAYRTINTLLQQRIICPTDSFLVVGAGAFDASMFRLLKLQKVTLSNLNTSNASAPVIKLNGAHLARPDNSYDHVVTRSTLHHMSQPHRAIHEMYRVCRKSVLFFESEDTPLMRLMLQLKLAHEYEMNANLRKGGLGGVDDRPIPNYVYRWTRREIEKTIRSLDPAYTPEIRFFKSWEIEGHVERILKFCVGKHVDMPQRRAIAARVSRVANYLLPSQSNNLGVVILKSMRRHHPWIALEGGEEVFKH